MTFIVRVTVAEDGAVKGVVERPKTGEKHRFQGTEALGGLVERMARKAAQVATLLALIAAAAAGPSAAQIPTRTFTQTATRTATFTSTPVPATPTQTATFTNSPLPTTTRSSTATFTSTLVPATPTQTATFTNSPLPTTTRSSTATFTSTLVPATPTQTATFTNSPLPTATRSSTATLTSTPVPPLIPLGLSIGDVAILEGDAGTRLAVFVISLRGPATYPVKVIAKTADGSATAGSDYDALSASLVFNAFENQKTVSVTVRGDRTLEPSETFSVRLGSAVGAPLGDPTGIGTILNDEALAVGVPELSPADPTAAPDETTTLTLRWAHPDRWRALNTVDLRLVDGDQSVFWARFDEAANTLAFCDPAGACGTGVPPGTGAPIASETATFYPAESAVQGSGPAGPSVDLLFTFSLDRSLGGRVLRVETAATDDSGEEQGFLPIGYLEVSDASISTTEDDGCAIQPARRGSSPGGGLLGLGLVALIRLATRRRRGPVR